MSLGGPQQDRLVRPPPGPSAVRELEDTDGPLPARAVLPSGVPRLAHRGWVGCIRLSRTLHHVSSLRRHACAIPAAAGAGVVPGVRLESADAASSQMASSRSARMSQSYRSSTSRRPARAIRGRVGVAEVTEDGPGHPVAGLRHDQVLAGPRLQALGADPRRDDRRAGGQGLEDLQPRAAADPKRDDHRRRLRQERTDVRHVGVQLDAGHRGHPPPQGFGRIAAHQAEPRRCVLGPHRGEDHVQELVGRVEVRPPVEAPQEQEPTGDPPRAPGRK